MNWTAEQVNMLIVSLTTLVAAVAALVKLFRMSDKLNEKIDAGRAEQADLHQQINGRMTELIDSTKAAGNLQGRADLKHEQAKK